MRKLNDATRQNLLRCKNAGAYLRESYKITSHAVASYGEYETERNETLKKERARMKSA